MTSDFDLGGTAPRKSVTDPEGLDVPVAADPLLERLRSATIGEYEVYGELGRGGMAAVYLAHEISLDRKVAIKVMLPELLAGDAMVERFKREARTAGALSHPHIIPIHAVRDVDGILFFVMKYVEGRGLDSIIGELGPLPLPMIQTILSQVAGALSHAHRRNVIHRDIKPANVMIDVEGWAVVTDFGIAKIADAKSLTATGAAIGTPYYMSPEQCSGKAVSGASDQYSLGIMAYEMLTGKTPFDGPSMMEVMSGHFFNAPGPIGPFRADCPPALEAAVMRMLAKEPGDRFASCEDVASAAAAPQLAHDHPVRTQMIVLARSGARQQPRMSVPISPSPPIRRVKSTAAARPSLPRLSLSQHIRQRPGLAVAGFLVLALVGIAGGVFAAQLRRQAAARAAAADTASARLAVQASLPVAPAADSSKRDSIVPTGSTAAPIPAPAPPPVRTPAPRTAVPSAREQASAARAASARRESVDRARRDSIAASALAATAKARSDSLATARADSIERARQDSVGRAQRAAAAVPANGFVVVGTRAAAAAYYIDGTARGVISGFKTLTLRSGDHRISISAEGCTPWDTTVTVRGGDTLRLGYHSPRCP